LSSATDVLNLSAIWESVSPFFTMYEFAEALLANAVERTAIVAAVTIFFLKKVHRLYMILHNY
jgi:hypothetical protein